MNRTDRSFTSEGVTCAAWHFEAESGALTGPSGRPCVVMAHGFGATRDSGLEAYAASFAAAGADALAFDYRGFGASGGEPRQLIDLPGQLRDYHAAIALARSLPGIDPERIVVWGVSMSGGHVFQLAADDQRIAAAIALTPAADGVVTMKETMKRGGLSSLKSMPTALRDAVGAKRGKPPIHLPLAGRPGELAALTAPGAYEAYTSLAGPSWENRFTARSILQVGRYRPGAVAAKITCPTLVQIADLDQTASPQAAASAARRLAVAEVRHYPCDHFDVYAGADWFAQTVSHQIDFLSRRLAPATEHASVD